MCPLLYLNYPCFFKFANKGKKFKKKTEGTGMKQKGLKVNIPKTVIMISGTGFEVLKDSARYPCSVSARVWGLTPFTAQAVPTGLTRGVAAFTGV